jgi:hypothetical protein
MRWLMMMSLYLLSLIGFRAVKPYAGVSHDGAETSPNGTLFLGCFCWPIALALPRETKEMATSVHHHFMGSTQTNHTWGAL